MTEMTAPTVEVYTEMFNDAYLPYLEDETPLQIYYGGSSSGKSVFVIGQRAVFDLMSGGRNYLICRQVGRTIRNSVFNEITKIITAWGVGGLFNSNKSDMVITCSNGYQILFAGLDDAEKLKSITPAKGVITDIVVEEATETELVSIKQLEKRLRGGSDAIKKRISLLFNPILQSHWIYNEYFKPIAWADNQKEHKSDELLILKTTYKDNRFLTRQDVFRLENEKDKYYYDVYTLGNWGILGSVIFKNWYVEDLADIYHEFTNKKFGLDFGFASDPVALHCSHYDKMRKIIYVFDEFYETELTNPELAALIKPIVGDEIVVCDSAEPKSIKELRDNKINAVSAKKGKDSVTFGIQWLQQQSIIIDKRCINARNELQTYKWKEGADGKPVSPPRPIDKNNHWIDATRYAYEEEGRDKPKARSSQG